MPDRVLRIGDVCDVVQRTDDTEPTLARPLKCDRCGAEVEPDYSCACVAREKRES